MLKKITKFTKVTQTQTDSAINYLETATNKMQTKLETFIAPTRQSILKRFPIMFSLLATFGVTTTFLGFEKLVARIPFLEAHPVVMLIVGISILATTGTLYKKLK